MCACEVGLSYTFYLGSELFYCFCSFGIKTFSFIIIIPKGITNYKANELHSLFIEFSAIWLMLFDVMPT